MGQAGSRAGIIPPMYPSLTTLTFCSENAPSAVETHLPGKELFLSSLMLFVLGGLL